jgi:hypothetical protein
LSGNNQSKRNSTNSKNFRYFPIIRESRGR